VTSLPGLTYLWSTGGTKNYITIKEAQVTEEYIVEVWNKAGCYFTDSILVEVIPSPHLTVTLDEDEQLITVDPFDLSRYIFYVNADTLQDGISNTFNYSDYLEIYDTIYVIAYNADGCSSYGDEDYAVINDGTVDPPLEKVNAFSPNGDGVNDRLMTGRKITVMDRTSKILYEGYDGWDGTFNGKEMPQGTYFYILYDDEGKLFYKGPVTILR
jgi:gliding motility-associated-like protein